MIFGIQRQLTVFDHDQRRLEMARKTSAQIAAEREAQLKLDFENFVKSWPDRLMDALEKASDEGMRIRVENGVFVVYFTESFSDTFVMLPYSASSWNDSFNLEDLDNELVRRKNKREEQARRANLKSAALSKLTKEERETLGL
jgi:hypothetical protein